MTRSRAAAASIFFLLLAALAYLLWDRYAEPALPASGAYLVASPNPVTPGSAPGRTTIFWSTGTSESGQVFVVIDERETLFAEGARGSQQVDWISGQPFSKPTAFRLYLKPPPAVPAATLLVRRDDSLRSFARVLAAGLLWFGAAGSLLFIAERRATRNTPSLARNLLVTLLVAGGAALTITVFRPGVMSPDSLVQYQEAAYGPITASGSPPIMSFVWRLMLPLVSGPLGMLVFHACVFWAGLGLIAAAGTRTAAGSAVAVLSIGLNPPVFALLGIIWKDVGMGAALTLFCGLVLTGIRRHSRALISLSVLPLMYGAAVRFNALPAIFPLACLLFLAASEVFRRHPAPLRRILGRSALATVLVAVLVETANRAIVSEPQDRPGRAFQGSMLHDLAGMSVDTGVLLLPSFLRKEPISVEWFRQFYNPGDGGNSFLYRSEFAFAQNGAEFDELRSVWIRSISDHPGAYVRQRGRVLVTLFQMRGIYDAFHRGIDPNKLGLAFPSRPLYDRTLRLLERATPLFFRGWLYLLLAIGAAWWAGRRGLAAPAAIALSGVAYVLPYILITGGSDFRYVWWLVLAAVISFVVLVAEMAWRTGQWRSEDSARIMNRSESESMDRVEDGHWWHLALRSAVVAHLRDVPPPGERPAIVDAGSGTGGLIAALRKDCALLPDMLYHSAVEEANRHRNQRHDLTRHFGERNAVLAGYRHVSGEWIVNIDDDLQRFSKASPIRDQSTTAMARRSGSRSDGTGSPFLRERMKRQRATCLRAYSRHVQFSTKRTLAFLVSAIPWNTSANSSIPTKGWVTPPGTSRW